MIDAVITYVDSSDKHWQNEYNKYVKRPLEEVVNRYRSYGVLDLQIECIRKFMPFVHRIFVVVSSRTQVPKSLLEMKDVVIVTHSDIIPKTYLPCFNSCVIEMFLSKIKGLSERFLYFNDDVFPINKCKPEDFFVDDKICMNYEFKNYDEENASIFQHNVINSTKIFYKENELSFNGIKPMHSVMPMLKSVCSVVLTENLKTIMLSLTRTRHSKNFNAYLFLNYMFKEHRFKPSTLKYKYIEIWDNIDEIENNAQLLCVNDNNAYSDFDDNVKELRKYLESLINSYEYKPSLNNLSKKFISNNLLSIIVPVYNAEQYLNKCIDSVLNNDYYNFELILVNDGSIDNSLQICNNYAKIDHRIKVIDKNNSGVSDSRNIGIDNANGKFISFLDSDDWIDKDRFIKPIKAMHSNNTQICQCGFKIFKNDENISNWIWKSGIYNIKDNILLSSAKYDIGHSCSKVYDLNLIKQNNIRFPKCDFCEDLIFNVKCYCFAEKLEIIAVPLYCYRRDVNNSLSSVKLSNERKLNLIKAIDNIIKELDTNKNFLFIKNNFIKFIKNAIKNRENSNTDIVISYINSNDRTWAAIYSDYINTLGDKFIHIPSNNFKYLFRSIEKNMENVGIIHFIVMKESMVPQWINTNYVHVITYDMIYNDETIIFSDEILNYINNIIGLSLKYEIIKDNMFFVNNEFKTDIDEHTKNELLSKSIYERKIDVNNFFSIGGNCTTLGILGQERNRGPLDNVGCLKGLYCFKFLNEGSILNEIFSSKYKIEKRQPNFENDSDRTYIFENFRLSHNNPKTEKYYNEFIKRYNNFLKFDISKNDNYYIYSINEYDINKKTGDLTDNFYKGIDYIKSNKILDKIIFVETFRKDSAFNNNSEQFENFCDIHNIKYIKIYDFDIWYVEETVHKFLNEIDKLNL